MFSCVPAPYWTVAYRRVHARQDDQRETASGGKLVEQHSDSVATPVRRETSHTQTHDKNKNNTTQHTTRTTPQTSARRTTPLT